MASSTVQLRVRYTKPTPAAPAAERLAAARAAANTDRNLAFRLVRQLLVTVPDRDDPIVGEIVELAAEVWPPLLQQNPDEASHLGMQRALQMRPGIAARLAEALEEKASDAAAALARALVFMALEKPARAAQLLVGIVPPPALAAAVDAACQAVSLALAPGQAGGWASGKRTPYPVAPDGKPFLSTVWLEVTSFCNQKCSFCPDPARESKRESIDVAHFKRVVDELQAHFHVGHMELNAYGEPLLHAKLGDMLGYLREKNVPWPTFFTSHGLTLLDSKIDLIDRTPPTGIAISLHNDSQESYEKTRSAKIGDYATLVERVSNLLRRLISKRRSCHVRLYLMVRNGKEAHTVPDAVTSAFPKDWRKFAENVRNWERITHAMAFGAGIEAVTNDDATIERSFSTASHTEPEHIDLVRWIDENGNVQKVFISPRPTGTYANLIPSMYEGYDVESVEHSSHSCGFTHTPSLAVFASGKLGICCIDLEGTANFGSLEDFGSLREAVTSEACLRFFGELGNGVASTSKGCQTCLGCATKSRP